MTTEAGKRPDLIREVRRAARGIDHSLADEPDYERFDAAIAAIEAEARAALLAELEAAVEGVLDDLEHREKVNPLGNGVAQARAAVLDLIRKAGGT